MLGERIKEYREMKGLTQKQVADILYVTPQAVSRWENGEVEPSISTCNEIAKLFNISLDELLGNEKPSDNSEVEYIAEEPVISSDSDSICVCERCHKSITDPREVVIDKYTTGVRKHKQEHTRYYCKECVEEMEAKKKQDAIDQGLNNRKRSFILGILAAVVIFAIFAITANSKGMPIYYAYGAGGAILAFTYVSCLLLQNNFIIYITLGIMKFSFGHLPGFIFSFSIGGFVMMIVTKLVLGLLGIALSISLAILGIGIGAAFSIFVYPFALAKNIKHPEISEY